MCLTENDRQCIRTIEPIFANCQALLNIKVEGGYKKLGPNALEKIYAEAANFNSGLKTSVAAVPIFSGGYYCRETDTVYFDFDKIYGLIESGNQNNLKITILHEVRHSYQKHEIDSMKNNQTTHESLSDIQGWDKSLGNDAIGYSNSPSEIDAIRYSEANYSKV